MFTSLGSVLISKFDYIDFNFHENEVLFELVNSKKIDFAIVTNRYDTFDTVQKQLGEIKQIIVGSSNIDATKIELRIKENNYDAVENWLNEQKWFSHDSGIPHIKLFWLHVFNKKRPSIVPNYIIPSEFEMLEVLSKNEGIAITWNINAKPFIAKNSLQLLWESAEMPITTVYLLSAKNTNFNTVIQEIEEELRVVLG